jgi:hypothetical protein
LTNEVHPKVLKESGRVLLWGLTMVAAVDFVGSWLHERPTGAAAVQLAIAEYGAGKLGIAWSPPDTVSPTPASIAKRALRGAVLGAGAAAILWGVGVATKTLAFRLSAPSIAEIGVGLIVATLVAARDELLLRGLLIRMLAPWTKGTLVLVACAAAGVARGWFLDGMTPNAGIAAGCGAIALACVWLVDRGAWMAVGANAAFLFASTTLGIGSSRAYAIAMGVIAAFAVAWWRVRAVPPTVPQKG